MSRAGASRTGRALCIGVDAEEDARTFASLARGGGFAEPRLLLGAAATTHAVRAAVRELAFASRPGDLALVTFSGHGGRKPIAACGAVPADAAIWQLWDGSLSDRQLREDLAAFAEGVRVLVLSDNCSGGVPERSPRFESPPLAAAVMVLAASRPHEYADGPGLPGHFARAVSELWNGGAFEGSYERFHRALVERMPEYQKPDLYRIGQAGFESERPFSI